MFSKEAKSFNITEQRDSGLVRRINAYAKSENLKPGTALRRFLDKHLPALPKSRKNTKAKRSRKVG